MRTLFERSMSVRIAVVVASAAVVLLLARAADAGDDLGIRRATLFPDALFSAFAGGSASPAPAPGAAPEPLLSPGGRPRSPAARRIWAAAHDRPLRIALEHRHRRSRSAKTEPVSGRRVAAGSPEGLPLAPPPSRTPLVSIYQDRTLRSGDAVMLADGVHVFRDDGFWPHRPRDFVRLSEVTALDLHLRRTLQPYDRNPPTRWTAIMMPPA